MESTRLTGWRAGIASMVVAVGVLGAPAAGQPEADTATILDSNGGSNKRVAAIDRLWAAALSGEVERAAARETLKQVIWKGSAPAPVRQAALAKLISDDSPDGQADNRKLIRLRLPTESQWPVIDAICREIASRAAGPDGAAWRETAAALVRSYARRVPTPPDPDRPERSALLALRAGEPIERIVFDVYMKPDGGQPDLPGQAPDIVEKQRQAAWELLGRLDPDGSVRRGLLAAVPADDPAVAPLTRAAADLKVVPITGSELAWLKSLIESKDPGATGWWNDARDAVARLSEEQVRGLQLRHIEAARWCAAHKTEWLSAERSTLLDELARRLEGRRLWRKTEGLGTGQIMSREALKDWQDQLVWGDLVTILVIDEALKKPRIIESLMVQAEADREDSSTEYGGVLVAAESVPRGADIGGKPSSPWGDTGEPGGFIVRGYSARPTQRVNDRTFVAPQEMFDADGAGGRVLAHYHFHAQTVNNADYAGPGFGDHEYAQTHGRACVVLTSVRPGVLNADYYHRGGVQIDLGEVATSR